MTRIELSREGTITEEVRAVADAEALPPELIRERTARGQIVIPANTRRKSRILGIGKGLRTKINASIGTSPDIADIRCPKGFYGTSWSGSARRAWRSWPYTAA